ncbi:MAG: malto-oligosyltrehalose synthase, partial [Chloroflexota bacterium]|nr:malto-oligosyltrehalose synthase [Chloroflexota bacterium]
VTDGDAAVIGRAVRLAEERRPELDPELFDFLGRILRLEVPGRLAAELATRFQQLTPAAMAKGVEDTAFYRHNRLVALNEVGGDPGRFGVAVDDFHAEMSAASAGWPSAMLALSTHDTKRSADLRARLAVLSQCPGEWGGLVEQLLDASAPHRASGERPTTADAYLFFQVAVGAWPIDADRAAAYMEKASREAKLRTSWTAPDAEYDEALDAFVRGTLADPGFVGAVEAFVGRIADLGWRAALAQQALQLTAPGVPDLYQGTELWDLSLVDPDNRRPVDYGLRRRRLADACTLSAAEAWQRRGDGIAKLWLIRRALALRQRRPGPFLQGEYRALAATGSMAGAVVAFARGDELVTVVPRLVHEAWDDTSLALPDGRWRDLDGVDRGGVVLLDELFRDFPVSILERIG